MLTWNEVGPELLSALRKAINELNAIRARDGAPLCIQWGPQGPMQSFQCSEDYFDDLVESCFAAIDRAEELEAQTDD